MGFKPWTKSSGHFVQIVYNETWEQNHLLTTIMFEFEGVISSQLIFVMPFSELNY
jgi:hypothetical protein